MNALHSHGKGNCESPRDKTPYLIMHSNVLREQVSFLKKAFRCSAPQLFYSVKTNPHPTIIRILLQEGLSFHVCSTEELSAALRQGVPPIKVLMYNPSFTSRDFRKLSKRKIRLFTIDSREQYDELLLSGITASILLRIRPFAAPRKNCYGRNSLGMEKETASSILCSKPPRRIRFQGLHMHIATQNEDLSSWKVNAQGMLLLAKQLGKSGIAVPMIDLGGGFPIPYQKKVPGIKEISNILKPLLTYARAKGINCAFEPGRFIAGPACELVTSAVLIKGNTVFVDASIYSASMDSLIGINLPVKGGGRGPYYIVRGKSPCTLDVFGKARLNNPQQGGKIIFSNAGAYTYSSDFMGYKKPRIIESDK